MSLFARGKQVLVSRDYVERQVAESCDPVSARTREERNPAIVEAREQPVAVPFDFMQPRVAVRW